MTAHPQTGIIRGMAKMRLVPVAAICLILAGAAMTIFSETHFKSQKIREASALTRILAASVTAALIFNDDQTAQEYVDALSANQEVQGVVLFGPDGAVVASYQRAGAKPLPDGPRNAAPSFESNRLSIEMPVAADGQRLGTVYLRLLTEPLERRIFRYGGIMLLVVMGALLVVVLGSSQAAMARANRELEKRATELAQANAQLKTHMEEREKAQEALRQSQKMEAIGQLVGGVAHDFNNILTAIINSLETLQRRMAAHEAVNTYVSPALQAARRGGALIGQLMVFSRKEPLEARVLDANAAVDEVLRIVERSLPESIGLTLHREGEAPFILADPAQFQTALLNLILNARDAMEFGGKVRISTGIVEGDAGDGAKARRHACVAVSDTGSGIAEEDMSRIFEPFFTTKGIGKGTGLGLSQVFGFMNAVEGDIEVDSRPGEGTTFRLLFPLQSADQLQPAPPVVPEAAPAPGAPDGTGRTLLFVEDDFLVTLASVEPLEEEGFTVYKASRGSGALKLLQGHPEIDLMVTDIGLPEMNGHDLVARARADRPDLKVIFVTGYDATDVAARTRLDARTLVLKKPYDVRSLINRIAGILQV
jgi:signal transduction histidine kinase